MRGTRIPSRSHSAARKTVCMSEIWPICLSINSFPIGMY